MMSGVAIGRGASLAARWLWLLLAPASVACGAARADPHPATETILFIRHGEKPAGGLGQLSCQGLNRALALPGMIAGRYGHVDAVFAANPAHRKEDGHGTYDYVRPLATVEPTAIRFGLPVAAEFGYEETEALRQALIAPAYHDATVLVGWEHHALNAMMPAFLAALGGDARAAEWARDDFDSIWRVTITWTGDKSSATFAIDHEGLNDQSADCAK